MTTKMDTSMNRSVRRIWAESKMMWGIAGPAILMAVSQFSLEFVTSAFVGHLGTLELAAVSIVHNVVEGFVYGLMTLCGQAVGAGQINRLGIYLQRSWIVTGVTALLLTPTYMFMSPILKFLHQDDQISDVAGKYACWVIPQLFAYALNFPIQKFLQSQSKVWVMTMISIFVLGIHTFLLWVLVTKSSFGLFGAAMAGNISWFILVLGQLIYVMSGSFLDAWTGFSLLAFTSLKDFIKLSIASAIIMNLDIWTLMIALGFNAAISVRLSNEIGAGRPRVAKLSVLVTVSTSAIIGTILAVMIIVFKNQYPKLFSDEPLVISEASKLSYFLAASVFLNSIQSVLHGVAVGAGWQSLVALINIGCYYLVGLPVGALLGYKFDLGVHGIWGGLLLGVLLQTTTLLLIVWKTNWHDE
ncbi:Protein DETOXIFICATION 33, partial [Bienertia sinuspersici]